MSVKRRKENVLYLRGMWQFVSLILFSAVKLFSYLATSFFLLQFFRMLIQTIFALRRAGKADVAFVVTASPSSLPVLHEA